MQLFIADAGVFFFNIANRPKTCPNHIFPLNKNVSLRDFYIMTLYIIAEKSHFGKNYSYRAEQSATKFNWRWNTLAIYARLVAPRFTLLLNRCLMVSTNQADPSCFYFRISWILMERCWFYLCKRIKA